MKKISAYLNLHKFFLIKYYREESINLFFFKKNRINKMRSIFFCDNQSSIIKKYNDADCLLSLFLQGFHGFLHTKSNFFVLCREYFIFFHCLPVGNTASKKNHENFDANELVVVPFNKNEKLCL